MNSIKKKWRLLNKSPLEKSMVKVTWSEEYHLAKQKHFVLISTEFSNSGLNFSNLAEPSNAVMILIEYLRKVSLSKWISALKTLMLSHLLLNEYPQQLSGILRTFFNPPQGMNTSTQTHKISNSNNSLIIRRTISLNKSESLIEASSANLLPFKIPVPCKNAVAEDALHIGLSLKYTYYLQALTISMDSMNSLEKSTIVSPAQFLSSYEIIKNGMNIFYLANYMQRDLESSLLHYKKVEAVSKMVILISINISRAYIQIKHILEIMVQDFKTKFSSPKDFQKFFCFYCEFIKHSRNIDNFNYLRNILVPMVNKEFVVIQVYQIDKVLNRAIELHNLYLQEIQVDTGSGDKKPSRIQKSEWSQNMPSNIEFEKISSPKLIQKHDMPLKQLKLIGNDEDEDDSEEIDDDRENSNDKQEKEKQMFFQNLLKDEDQEQQIFGVSQNFMSSYQQVHGALRVKNTSFFNTINNPLSFMRSKTAEYSDETNQTNRQGLRAGYMDFKKMYPSENDSHKNNILDKVKEEYNHDNILLNKQRCIDSNDKATFSMVDQQVGIVNNEEDQTQN